MIRTASIALALALPLAAQGGTTHPTATLASNLGVLAQQGGAADFDAIAARTVVSRRGERASAAVGRRLGDHALATSLVRPIATRDRGIGVVIREAGEVANSDPGSRARAGTSADAPGTRQPGLGGHTVRVAYPGLAQGTPAVVYVRFRGDASAGASANATVDVDGDGRPDFGARANGQGHGAAIPVTAGPTGVTVDIRTEGLAVAAGGRARYGANLEVTVRAGSMPVRCAFTNFGRACGADLDGAAGPNQDLVFRVSNAAPNRMGFLAMGDRAMTPTPLPIGSCALLIDPTPRMTWSLFQTDGSGQAAVRMRAPAAAVTRSFQALVWDFDRATQTRTIDASNGTEVVCQ